MITAVDVSNVILFYFVVATPSLIHIGELVNMMLNHHYVNYWVFVIFIFFIFF